MQAMSLTARTGILALGNLAYRLGQTFALIGLVRLVSPDQVGTYREVWVLYNSLYVFFLLGLPGSTYYHLAAAEPGCHRSFLRQTAALLVGLGGLFALILVAAAPPLATRLHNPELRSTLVALAPLAFFSTAQAFGYPALVVYRRAGLAAGIMAGFSVGQLAITVVVPILGGSLTVLFLLLGALSAVRFLLTMWLVWSLAPQGEQIWHARGLRHQLGYSVPLCLADASRTLQGQIDKVVASVLYLPAQFANYSLGAVPLPFITVIRTAIFSVLISEVSALRTARETRRIVRIWQSAVRKTALISHPLMWGGISCAVPLISVLYTGTYEEAAIPFRIYLVMLAFMAYPALPVLLALGQSFFQLEINLLGIALTCFLGALAARPLGLAGPALGALLAAAVVIALQLRRIARTLNVRTAELLTLRAQIPSAWTAALAAIPCFALTYLVWKPWATLAAQVPIYCISYLFLLSRSGGLSTSDREQLKLLWTNLKGLNADVK